MWWIKKGIMAPSLKSTFLSLKSDVKQNDQGARVCLVVCLVLNNEEAAENICSLDLKEIL
jgi:hypothetical protein